MKNYTTIYDNASSQITSPGISSGLLNNKSWGHNQNSPFKDSQVTSAAETPKLNQRNKLPSQNNSFSERLNSGGRSDKSKRLEDSNIFKNRLAHENNHTKASTLTEKQLKPVKRLNHSLRDASIPDVAKTPVLTTNKGEGLNSKIEKSALGWSNQKEKYRSFQLKSESSRNHNIFSSDKSENSSRKHPTPYSANLLRRSEEITKKKKAINSASLNKRNTEDSDLAKFTFHVDNDHHRSNDTESDDVSLI